MLSGTSDFNSIRVRLLFYSSSYNEVRPICELNIHVGIILAGPNNRGLQAMAMVAVTLEQMKMGTCI